MSNAIKSTLKYKLIYIFSVPLDTHKGCVKIGEATVDTSLPIDQLVPNCKVLNDAAKTRIRQYATTSAIPFTLLHTELAVRTNRDGELVSFSDKDVHDVLENSGYDKQKLNGTNANEWFKITSNIGVNAIKAVKENRTSLNSSERVQRCEKIVFRNEQEEAINMAIDVFKKRTTVLWYAKMRFGKTLAALELVRRKQYKRVLIATHRPVVGSGWNDDFGKIFFDGNTKNPYSFEFKTDNTSYDYDAFIDNANDAKLKNLIDNDEHFIYFASIQDLRGSKIVGGNFDKNKVVFSTDWDLIIIDEAHEGTATELGEKVQSELIHDCKSTKVLSLSGTPFKLLANYDEDNIYTWDYIAEQQAKAQWFEEHPWEHNPYADLPTMHIMTYSLNDVLKEYVLDENGRKAFNFKEFFRVYTLDYPNVKPENAGKFVHEDDVKQFLDMLCDDTNDSGYPYSTAEYREMFSHTLWVVPGVKEAAALSELIQNHPAFSGYGFKVVNVAGTGDKDEESHPKDALEYVKKSIKENPYTITLSCGRLTTGVTVKEWTAVFYLKGSATVQASSYLQTIFRVQSAGCVNGKQKTDCYVFDFSPDRALQVIAENAVVYAGLRGTVRERDYITAFLNYCPVIAMDGSYMRQYNTDQMMQEIKYIHAEHAVASGFDDTSLYNDTLLLTLDKDDEKLFADLQRIIGRTYKELKNKKVTVNDNGLTEDELAKNETGHKNDRDKDGNKRELTPEEIERLEKLKDAKKQKDTAISILRGVSVRMPLLIYGANVDFDEDITLERFIEIVEDKSWEEFMPKGVTKEKFLEIKKFYDPDIFVAAGRKIRSNARSADNKTPTERVKIIANIFRHFRNPDKETVLTPWRVVNMHMSDTLGGWCFFNEQFEDDDNTGVHTLDEPRFVDRGDVTKEVFGSDSKILEINSKTGLYPLYCTYSIYRNKLGDSGEEGKTLDELNKVWDSAVRDNIFVVCKTPMAKSITQRTLMGYRDGKINAHAFDDLINQLKNKPDNFRQRVLNGRTWNKGGITMKFDAVVGNPPYQVDDGGAQASASPVYHFFIEQGEKLKPNYLSMIVPSRWMTGGKGLDTFREKMINDTHIRVLHDFANSTDCFSAVDIKGGVCYFLRDKSYNGECECYRHDSDGTRVSTRYLHEDDDDFFIRDERLIEIKNKVWEKSSDSVERIVSASKPYGLRAETMRNAKKYGLPEFSDEHIDGGYNILGLGENQKRMWKHIPKDYPLKKMTDKGKYKVFISEAYGCGEIGEVPSTPVLGTPVLGTPDDICTETFLQISPFDTKHEAENFIKYIHTKLFRALVGIKKQTQHTTQKVYRFVPLQDFTSNSDIDWSVSVPEIDRQLYAKYGLDEDEIAFVEEKIKPME